MVATTELLKRQSECTTGECYLRQGHVTSELTSDWSVELLSNCQSNRHFDETLAQIYFVLVQSRTALPLPETFNLICLILPSQMTTDILLLLLLLLISHQRSCATSDPVSTRMGDRLWTGKPFRYVTSQLGQLSLSSLRGR